MSGKKYKQLRREAREHGIPYEIVKKVFRNLSTAVRRRILQKQVLIDDQFKS